MATPTVYTPRRLIIPALLGTTNQRYYVSPASPSLGTQLKEIILTNVTGVGGITATVFLVESGAFPSNNNRIISTVTIPTTGIPLIVEFDGLYMNASDEIYARASTANVITIHLSGVELS